MNIGKSIRVALAQKDMTKTDLAAKLGIHLTGISQFSNRECVKSETIQKLANVFEMKVSEFVALGED